MTKQLAVGIFPYGGPGNPYQDLIADALRQRGMLVTKIPSGGKFSALTPLRGRTLDVIHLDWIHGIFRGRNVASTITKAASLVRTLPALNTPCVMTVHNVVQHEAPRMQRMDERLERSIVERVDGFVHFSDAGRRAWEARHPYVAGKPSTIIREGNVVSEYDNCVSRHDARRALSIGTQTPIVGLCFGNIRKYKGFANFAARFLAEAPSQAVLLVAGSPSDADEAQRINEVAEASGGAVQTHLRWIPQSDVQLFMNAADVGFAPFQAVNNSGSVTLMNSFGLPVAAPTMGGIDDLLVPGRSINLGDRDRTIERALNLGVHLRGTRDLGIGETLRRQSWSIAAERVIWLYEDVLEL